MKKILVSVMLLVAALSAGEIHWAKDFDSAMALAKKENKPVYMLITSDRCRWCQRLKIKTLSDKEVIERLNGSYIALDVNRERDKIPSMYRASMVPTTYFLAPNGKVLVKIPGYWNVEDYLSIMDDADRKLHKFK